jgi:porphobilinogen deaminase
VIAVVAIIFMPGNHIDAKKAMVYTVTHNLGQTSVLVSFPSIHHNSLRERAQVATSNGRRQQLIGLSNDDIAVFVTRSMTSFAHTLTV